MRIDRNPFSGRSRSTKGEKLFGSEESEESSESFLELLVKADMEMDMPEISANDLDAGELKNLAGLISQTGDELTNNPTSGNFLKYKRYISLFIEGLKKNTEHHSRQVKIPFKNTQKQYDTFHAIDEALSKLADKILSQEVQRLELLQLTEQIKGLVVDLMS